MGEKIAKRNIVLIEVRRAEAKTKGRNGIGFNELVNGLKGRASRVTISKSLDSLFDMGLLTSEWALADGKWRKIISTSNESRDIIDHMIHDLETRGLI